MPHGPIEGLREQINNPDNWLTGAAGGPGGKAAAAVPAAIKALTSAGVRGSAQDMLHPSALKMLEKMFKEANPVFKKLQQQGVFKHRMNAPGPVSSPIDRLQATLKIATEKASKARTGWPSPLAPSIGS